MSYVLGIDVGAERTVAAVVRAGSGGAEAVDLGDGDGVASVLHLGADGVLAVGSAAERWAPTEPDRVVRGFPGRIGDGDAMLLAGEPWAPEELTAWLVRWVVDRVAEREGGPAQGVAVTHPGSWDADRTQLLADAVAEQDLDVTFVAPGAADPSGEGDVADEPAGAPSGAARAAALAAQAAAGAAPTDAGGAGSGHPVDGFGSGRYPIDGPGSGRHLAVGEAEHPVDGTGSGRHPVVGGAIAALAAGLPGETGTPATASGEYAATADLAVEDDVPVEEDDATEPAADEDDGPVDGDPGPGASGHGPTSGSTSGGWDVPAPRSPDGSPRPEPATAHLLADLVGFTGGMGATNTAGLLSGYTPPHGMPAAWSGGNAAAGRSATGTATRTGTATGRAVALLAQRGGSGRWAAVAPAAVDRVEAAPAAVRARNNPTVLVSAGGLAAAVAVVGTLFLWPAPRTTNTATSRPVAAVPVATTPVQPTAAPVPETPTVEATPTRRRRAAADRARPPAVVPTPQTAPADTTPPPTASGEPTVLTTTSARPSEETEPPSTEPPSTEPEND